MGWSIHIILFEQDRADGAGYGVFVREDADDLGTAFDLTIEPLERVGRVQLGPMLRREGHVGEDLPLSRIYELGELGNRRPKLVGYG